MGQPSGFLVGGYVHEGGSGGVGLVSQVHASKEAPSLRQSLVPSLRSAQRQNTYAPGVHTEVPLLEPSLLLSAPAVVLF